jgi:hypothetical protein
MVINDKLRMMWKGEVVTSLNVTYYYHICLEGPIE